jgi:hypothetical protein
VHVKQLEHPACFVDAVKKPGEQSEHDDAPPTENVPAKQSEQILSVDEVPCDEMCVPAAQYVWVVHDEATAAENFPLAHSVHAATVPPALSFPAAQSAHALSTVEVHATVWNLPAAQTKQLVHAA